MLATNYELVVSMSTSSSSAIDIGVCLKFLKICDSTSFDHDALKPSYNNIPVSYALGEGNGYLFLRYI